MTNKLPEVGKRYRHKQYRDMEIEIIAITKLRIVYEVVKCSGNSAGSVNSYAKNVVWNFIEELQEDNSNQETSAKNAQVNELEEAKEGLQSLIYRRGDGHKVTLERFYELKTAAKNLLCALDNQQSNNHQINEGLAAKAEEWLNGGEDVCLSNKEMYFDDSDKSIRISDLIKSIESIMLSKQDELEARINKLENER